MPSFVLFDFRDNALRDSSIYPTNDIYNSLTRISLGCPKINTCKNHCYILLYLKAPAQGAPAPLPVAPPPPPLLLVLLVLLVLVLVLLAAGQLPPGPPQRRVAAVPAWAVPFWVLLVPVPVLPLVLVLRGRWRRWG